MASLNKVLLIGNLTRDPETRYLPSGGGVCNFAVATNERYTDKAGQKKERVEYHNITMFGKLAEIAQQYLKKGANVYLEGRIQTEKWQDKETGADKSKTVIVCDLMQMIGGRREGDQGQQAPQQRQEQKAAPKGKSFDDFEDDIQFISDCSVFDETSKLQRRLIRRAA